MLPVAPLEFEIRDVPRVFMPAGYVPPRVISPSAAYSLVHSDARRRSKMGFSDVQMHRPAALKSVTEARVTASPSRYVGACRFVAVGATPSCSGLVLQASAHRLSCLLPRVDTAGMRACFRERSRKSRPHVVGQLPLRVRCGIARALTRCHRSVWARKMEAQDSSSTLEKVVEEVEALFR